MNTDDKDLRTVAFRCPERLASALERLADERMCSMSAVARSAVLREVKEHGLMTGEPAAAA